MIKLNAYMDKYQTPKALKRLTTLFLLLLVLTVFICNPFRFYTAYFTSPEGDIITVSTDNGTGTLPGSFFKGSTFYYNNGQGMIQGAAPEMGQVWDMYGRSFGYDVGPILAMVMKALCVIGAAVALAFIWMNRPKVALIATFPFPVTFLLSYFRNFDYTVSQFEKYWVTTTSWMTVYVIKGAYYVLWGLLGLVILMAVIALLTTKKKETETQPVFMVNSQSDPIPMYAAAQPVSQPEELRKYKQLLDEGVITQEEFDAKKKQLLGL